MGFTMPRTILSLLSGLAVGLALGLSTSSSRRPGLRLSGEKAEEETLYRGQPASYWLRRAAGSEIRACGSSHVALARLGPEPEHARAVAVMLEDKNQGVRSGAALNLGRMGPAAASTVPQLLTALRDEDQFVRIAAVRALARICPQDDAALHRARRARLQDEKPDGAT